MLETCGGTLCSAVSPDSAYGTCDGTGQHLCHWKFRLVITGGNLKDYIHYLGVERMKWPACRFNPIEYFWDQLGSAVLVRVTNAATLSQFIRDGSPTPVIKTF